MPVIPPRYGARRLAAMAGFALLGVAPPVGLWAYAGSAAQTAERGNVPTTVAAAPLAHVATPLLSARRLPGVVAGADPSKDLRAKAAELPVSDTSCLAVAVDGAPVFSVRPDLAVVPASNMKLLTAAAALEVLTPTFTYTTTLLTATQPDGAGVLEGDLFLAGGGDPLLSTKAWRERQVNAEHQGVPYTSLEALADDLKSKGVQSITGAIVGSDTRYDNEYVQPSWPTDLDPYSRPGAISALRVDGGVDAKGLPFADPAAAAATRFTIVLKAAGIAVAGAARSGPVPDGQQPIAQVSSAPLSEIAGSMLRVSDNGVAEMLVKEVGANVSGSVGTWAAGLEAVRAQLANWKVPDVGVSLVDGSGLSGDDHLTCQVILGVVSRYKIGDPLIAGLPVAATSGTLLGDFQGSPVAGQLLAKTGTLSNVRALAGVLPRQGHLVQFAYVMNEPGIGKNNQASVPRWNQLMTALLAFPFAPELGAYEPAAALTG